MSFFVWCVFLIIALVVVLVGILVTEKLLG